MQVQQIQLPGTSGSLAAVAYGNPVYPPVLALHGWLDNADSFAALAPLLDDHYLVALDLAGHGGSAHRPAGTIYHLTDYVADLAFAIRQLGWQKLNLLGHSLGAGVCMLYAAAYPEQVSRLIMIDGLGPTTGDLAKMADRLRRSVDAGVAESTTNGIGSPNSASENPVTKKTSVQRPARIYQSWEQLIAARRQASPLSETAAELLVRRNALENQNGIHLRTDRRLRHPSPLYLSEEMALHFIGQIQAHSLLITASDGVVVKSRHTEGRISAFRNLAVVELEGQHHLHMDSPLTVAAVINPFLAGPAYAD